MLRQGLIVPMNVQPIPSEHILKVTHRPEEHFFVGIGKYLSSHKGISSAA
jgi:hypothetical protein